VRVAAEVTFAFDVRRHLAERLSPAARAAAIITSAKKLMLSSAFVRLLAGLRQKTAQRIFRKFGGKAAYGPRQDFVGNLDNVAETVTKSIVWFHPHRPNTGQPVCNMH